MNKKFDFAIIGAGVIGLAIGSELLKRDSKLRVIILEKEKKAGQHASGRNSGVIHSGFYYSPDSLKAKLTKDGNQLLLEYARTKNLNFRTPGKVVVAMSEIETKRIHDLYARGKSNGVNVEIVSRNELTKIEPFAFTKEIALWSPNTGLGDPKALITELEKDFLRMGGEIIYGEPVIQAENQMIYLKSNSIGAKHIINSAGLYADKIAHKFGYGLNYTMIPFMGLYLHAPNQRDVLRTHIYPTPDPRNPFLGVHLTVTLDNSIKIGPTAIPLLSREQYELFSNIHFQEFAELMRVYPKFLLSRHHQTFSLLRTELPKLSKRIMLRQAKKLSPELNLDTLITKGKSGIRAQLFDVKEKKLEMDFVLQGDKQSTHILNAVSPGWTTCFSFSKFVCDQIRDKGIM